MILIGGRIDRAAGTAAAQAIEANCAVQDLPYAPLAARLTADGQVLSRADSDALATPNSAKGNCK